MLRAVVLDEGLGIRKTAFKIGSDTIEVGQVRKGVKLKRTSAEVMLAQT